MNRRAFFPAASGLTVGDLAALVGATFVPESTSTLRIVDIAPLDSAGPSDLAFFDNRRYADDLKRTLAGACLVSARHAEAVPRGTVALVSRKPYEAFVTAARTLFPDALSPRSSFGASGIASAATVHPTAKLEKGAVVDPGAVIGPAAEIGSGTVIGAGATIGPGVRVGRRCGIGAGATLAHALVGDRVIIHPGCRIGQDGFGYVLGARGHLKVPQLGRVIIQDDVEIGANSTVDRGFNRDTVIGEGTKVDNLVQIAHNVTIGRHCVIAAQTGISGSCVLEDFAILAGKVGLADHVRIGSGAQIAAGSGLMNDVPSGAKWGGYPAGPAREWLKMTALLRRLVKRGGDSMESGPAKDLES